MSEGSQIAPQEKSVDKKLVIILVALVLVIVILVVGIFLVKKPSGSDGSDDVDEVVLNGEVQASNINKEIEDKLISGKYVTRDAINRYEEEIETGDATKRIELAYRYAYFVLDVNEDLTTAISIVNRIKPLISDKTGEVHYYETLRDLCIKAKDSNCTEQYKNTLNEIMESASESNQEGEIINE